MDIRQPSRQSPVTGEAGVRAGDSQQHRAAVSVFVPAGLIIVSALTDCLQPPPGGRTPIEVCWPGRAAFRSRADSLIAQRL